MTGTIHVVRLAVAALLSSLVVGTTVGPASAAPMPTYAATIGWTDGGSSADGYLKLPLGVATDTAGNVWVADTTNRRVQEFTASGTFVRKIGTGVAGVGEYDFKYPSGIAVDSTGRIYVSDVSNHRVQVFDADGAYVSTIGKAGETGTDNDHFDQPGGLAVDKGDNLYVADTHNHRVQKFEPSGQWVATFGTTAESGNDEAHLSYPNGVTVDAAGNVYIADTFNQRVQKLDAAGKLVATFGTGTAGSGPSQFYYPDTVAIDAEGFIAVADSNNNRVQIFDTAKPASNGAWKTLGTGTSGTDNTTFDHPSGVAADQSGHLYIADSNNNRIQKFNLNPTVAPGAPTAVRADSDLNGCAYVRWTAPTNNGGSAITGYDVTPYVGSTPQTIAHPNGAQAYITVCGLQLGTSYTFTVAAQNAIGTGAASAPSNAMIAATRPGLPTNVVATAGDGSVSLTWTAPTDTGGRPIESYDISIANSHGTSRNTANTAFTWTGLTNGTSYAFVVAAYNGHAWSGNSVPSNTVTPRAPSVPGVPTGVSATAGNAEATVTWTAPADSGTSAITGYELTPFKDGLAQTPVTVGAVLSKRLTGLANGSVYTFKVAAINAVGTGTPSAASTGVTPSATPTPTPTPTPTTPSTPVGKTFIGTKKKDVIQGTPGDDIIYAKAGNDVVYGNGGNDTIIGGAGNDKLYGGDGNDTLKGGSGLDTCDGGAGTDAAAKNCEKKVALP